MKKLKIFTICALGLTTAVLTSCKEQSDEIVSYVLSRNLSPLNLEATNVGETTADIRWTASNGATSYNIQVFADDSLSYNMEGTPAFTKTGVTEIPYAISGLFYDTKYTVYVQAITEGNEGRTSKWNGAYFRTSAKQFLINPKPADIADRSVILTWEVEEGYDVSTIVIGNITHEITAEEKEARKATITGLEPETAYTAYLYYNGKQCGNRNFTTIADLEGAIIVHPEDNFTSLLKNAEDGQVFALYGGNYLLNYKEETDETSQVEISASITIKGIYPTDAPVIYGRFGIVSGSSLTINQVVLDGSKNNSTDQAFVYKTAGDFTALNVTNSTIRNYDKGVFYNNTDNITIESVVFDKCIFHNITCSNDMFDNRKAWIGTFTISNSTIYNSCASRSMIRYDDKSSNYAGKPSPVVTLTHCTIDGVETSPVGTSNMNGYTYVRYKGHQIVVTNNLITNSSGGSYSRNAQTTAPTFSDNYYFGCGENFFKNIAIDGTVLIADVNGKNGDDPKYKDTANGDFTIGNESVAKLKVGDPRWYTAQ